MKDHKQKRIRCYGGQTGGGPFRGLTGSDRVRRKGPDSVAWSSTSHVKLTRGATRRTERPESSPTVTLKMYRLLTWNKARNKAYRET